MPDSNVRELELRLVEQAASGDDEARRELFVRYRKAAQFVAMRVTGNEQDALDVVQDAYIKAFAGLDKFKGGASFKTWLLRIVTNRALDLLRSQNVRKAVSLDDEEQGAPDIVHKGGPGRPTDVLQRRESAKRLREAIETLPPAQRAVLALYAEGDVTYGQIAEILGVPMGTVMSRIHHARRQLREKLPDLAGKTAQRSNNDE